MSTNKLNIFIASSAEMAAEREKAILFLNQIEATRKHLSLKPIHWEYDVVHGSGIELDSFQDAINPKLEESSLVVFIFHSKIGKWTREEFELAKQLKKKIIPFFKEGFSPNITTMESFKEMLQFKEESNGYIQWVNYQTPEQFETKFKDQLQLFLEDSYPSSMEHEKTNLSEDVMLLMKLLTEKQNKIELLQQELSLPDNQSLALLEALQKEREELLVELNQNKEIQAKQAKEKLELEDLLKSQITSDQLKKEALKQVEAANYAKAEELLKQSAESKITDVAATFYELGKLNSIQLKFKEALHYLELANTIKPDDSEIGFELGGLYNELGFNSKAINCLTNTINIISNQRESNPVKLSFLYKEIGEAHLCLGEFEQAKAYVLKSVQLDISIFGEYHHINAINYRNLGKIYDSLGDYNLAIQYFNKAISLVESEFGADHTILASYFIPIGMTYVSIGDYNNALLFYNRADSILQKNYNENLINVAINYNNMGCCYDFMNETNMAIDYFEKAIEINKMFYGEEHPEIGRNYLNIGSSYFKIERFDLAIKYLESAKRILTKFYGNTHPNLACVYSNLGLVYDNSGDLDEALTNHLTALEIDKKFHGEGHQFIAQDLNNIASVLYKAHEFDKALEYFQAALKITEEIFEAQHESIITIKNNIQLVLAARKNN